MTALVHARETVQMDLDTILTRSLELPVDQHQHHWPGSIVATSVVSGGLTVVPTQATGLIAQGISLIDADNSLGAKGAIRVRIKAGTFGLDNSSGPDAITIADRGSICYLVDDHTVAKSSGGGARSPAGTIVDVQGSQVFVALGQPSLNDVVSTGEGLQAVQIFNATGSGSIVNSATFANIFTPVTNVFFNGNPTQFYVAVSVEDVHGGDESWNSNFQLTISGVTGSPFFLGSINDTLANKHRSQRFMLAVNNIPAGSHTVGVQFNRSLGAGSITFTSVDFCSVAFIEL